MIKKIKGFWVKHKMIICYFICMFIFLVCISFFANKIVNAVKKEGLKNIVNEVWEGESSETKTD